MQNKEIAEKIYKHTEIKASIDTGQDPEKQIKYLQQEKRPKGNDQIRDGKTKGDMYAGRFYYQNQIRI